MPHSHRLSACACRSYSAASCRMQCCSSSRTARRAKSSSLTQASSCPARAGFALAFGPGRFVRASQGKAHAADSHCGGNAKRALDQNPPFN